MTEVAEAANQITNDRQRDQAALDARQCVEFAAEGASGAEEERLDRADANLEVASDLVVGPALLLPQA